VFKKSSLDVEGPLSRFLYRIYKGPDIPRILKNYASIDKLPADSIETVQKVITFLQTGSARDYAKLVPTVERAINGWFVLREAQVSMKCYERIAKGVCGIELIRTIRRFEKMGYDSAQALAMSKRVLRPTWDVFEERNKLADWGVKRGNLLR